MQRKKIDDIVKAMTPEQKMAQMILASEKLLPEFKGIGNLGGVLAEGNSTVGAEGTPSFNSLVEWKKFTLKLRENALETAQSGGKEYVVIPELGTDAITGDQHVAGSILGPHSFTLSQSHNLSLVEEQAYQIGLAAKKSGFTNVYGPELDMIPHPVKSENLYYWGRTAEAQPLDPEWVEQYAYHYCKGMLEAGMIPSVKHWPGPRNIMGYDDGVDEGNLLFKTQKEKDEYIELSTRVYKGAYDAAREVGKTLTMMASYHSIEDKANSSDKQATPSSMLGKDFYDEWLFGKGFNGYVMSDYSSMEKATAKFLDKHIEDERKKYKAANGGSEVGFNEERVKESFKMNIKFYDALVATINTGVDMLMIGPNYHNQYVGLAGFEDILLNAIKKRDIPEERVNEAVTRILTSKIERGLCLTVPEAKLEIEKIKTEIKELEAGRESRAAKEQAAKVALQAAEESLVLLKNTLPANEPLIGPDASIVFLGEPATEYRAFKSPTDHAQPQQTSIYPYNNIGRQCGPWNQRWQGREGNEHHDKSATSLLEAAEKAGIRFTTPCEEKKREQPGFFATTTAQKEKLAAKEQVAVVVLSEPPYAEFMGDIANGKGAGGATYDSCRHINPSVPSNKLGNLVMDYDAKTLEQINKLKKTGVKVVTVVLSGRPVILNHGKDSPENLSDAIVFGGLPGTQGGEAIMNALTGKYQFGKRHEGDEYHKTGPNKLTMPWIELENPNLKLNRSTILTLDQVKIRNDAGFGLEQTIQAPGVRPSARSD